MDDDPVLRSLDAEFERDDPALAAFLRGHRARRRSAVWLLLVLPLLLPALLLPARVVLGLLAMLLILSSPVMVCWLCADTEAGAIPRTEPPGTQHPGT